MNKLVFYLVVFTLLIGLNQVFAVSTGSDLGIDFETEDTDPMIFMNTTRLVIDDSTPTGRNIPGDTLSNNTATTNSRTNNYAFEGEKIVWHVLIFDRNGIETLDDPVVTVGAAQGAGNDEEATCSADAFQPADGAALTSFNARDGNVNLTFDGDVMRLYTCTFTVESAGSMFGEFFVTAEVEDSAGNLAITNENEFWWFNPLLALTVEGTDPLGGFGFGAVTPGSTSYSNTITIENDATADSGVLLEMFISGTDFHDPAGGAAKCPTTNELSLTNFRYLATNGAHSSALTNPTLDAEGYDSIPSGADITMSQEIIGGDAYLGDTDWREAGNVLAPGAEIAVTLKLNLPTPCTGDFTDGTISFWALAV